MLFFSCLLDIIQIFSIIFRTWESTYGDPSGFKSKNYGDHPGKFYNFLPIQFKELPAGISEHPWNLQPIHNVKVVFESDSVNIITEAAAADYMLSGDGWTFHPDSVYWKTYLEDILRSPEFRDIIDQAKILGGAATIAVFSKLDISYIRAILRKLPAHKHKIIAIVILGIGIMFIVNPQGIWLPILDKIGFGPLGPKAGSWASFMQSPNTAAKSVFAILQSAAMGGYGAAVLDIIVQTFGRVMVIAALVELLELYSWFDGETPGTTELAVTELYSELATYWSTGL